jgi:hypothetical protein
LRHPPYFTFWKFFVWLAFSFTLLESLIVVTNRILFTPYYFSEDKSLKDIIDFLRMILEYLVIPIANTFRSFGSIALTVYLCKEQTQAGSGDGSGRGQVGAK